MFQFMFCMHMNSFINVKTKSPELKSIREFWIQKSFKLSGENAPDIKISLDEIKMNLDHAPQ